MSRIQTVIGQDLVLPSASSASRLVGGDLGALPLVAAHTAGRAALVGAGLFLAGARGRELVKFSVAGALAIEAFVLAYAAATRQTGMSGATSTATESKNQEEIP